MCGIAGVVGPSSVSRGKVIRDMCAAIRHRGPDAEGIYESNRIALGMRRLSIIDIKGGAQPVYNEARTVVAVFNGEIYNYRDLQVDLRGKGHFLNSEADSDVIPHLYEEYGANLFTYLRGMFSIAIWDTSAERLLLARDRLGKKPLYYRLDNGGMAFASEMKALLADPATDRTVDECAISDYLTFQYVPAPLSAIKSVRKVSPANVLVYEAGNATSTRYWRLNYRPQRDLEHRTQEDLAGELRDRLLDSVRVRLMSERPLGAFLSGGLDSSAIVAAMSRVSSNRISTFSIGFEDESFNELPYARQVAEIYGTDHHELIVRPDIVDLIPMLARAFDEPFADSSAIPSYALAAMSREHVVVALNGDGGDETFGGYHRYPHYLQSTPLQLPRPVARFSGLIGEALQPWGVRSNFLRRSSRAAHLLAESNPARRYARLLSYFASEQKMQILDDGFQARTGVRDSYEEVEQIWRDHRLTDPVNRLLAVDTYTYLPGDLLTKVDITTMAVSLEARSPMLDHTLLEWAASLPGDLKVRNGTTKFLFKKALAPWLPAELIDRKKMGFGIPLAKWLRGPLKPVLFDLLTDQTARDRGWTNPSAVESLLAAHMGGDDCSARLYALLMLEMWHREVLSVPAAAAA